MEARSRLETRAYYRNSLHMTTFVIDIISLEMLRCLSEKISNFLLVEQGVQVCDNIKAVRKDNVMVEVLTTVW